jgi:K+/H+ antiporter YhaU regulatory subunit KhtT
MPGIGELFELVARAGPVVTVVSQRSGRKDVHIGLADADEPIAAVSLTRAEATALAALLVGAHIELTTDPSD